MKTKRFYFIYLAILIIGISLTTEKIFASNIAENLDFSDATSLSYTGEEQDLGTGFTSIPKWGKFHIALTGTHSYVGMQTYESTCNNPACGITNTMRQWIINNPAPGTQDIYFSNHDIGVDSIYSPNSSNHLLVDFFTSSYNPGDEIFGTAADTYSGGSCKNFWGYGYCNTLSDLFFSVNDDEDSVTINSDVTASTTWHKETTYIVSGNISVSSGVTLTIEPGTVIKFDTTISSSIVINGVLVAEGLANTSTSNNQILFTSLKDDSFGGDTNNDGNTTLPTNDDWGGIEIGPSGIASFSYATIQYAGGNSDNSQIFNNGGTLGIGYSTIAHSSMDGIKNFSGSLTVTDTDIGFNGTGINIVGGSTGPLSGNYIHDNGSYGIKNNTLTTIDAEDNYWVDDTGPYNSISNPSGTGDAVSGNVDFDPWLHHKYFVTNELFPGCLPDSCFSVNSSKELHWYYDTSIYTSYGTEVSNAVSTWDALGDVDMINDNISPDVVINEVNFDDVSWKGQWDPNSSPHEIGLNNYYLNYSTTDEIQNTITHELGHALGLAHSYTGNIMYFSQTDQTSLGLQDTKDYKHLWH